jgi:carboxylesterase type B
MTLTHTEVIKFLNASLSEKLLLQYGLSETQTSDVTSIADLLPRLIGLKTDELFCASIHRFTREFSKAGAKVYSYHLDRGNTFSGPMNNVAHHALDLQYVFGNFLKGFKDKKDVELSKALMKFWIGFAYGKAPWDDVSSGKALHIRTDGELEVVPREEVKSRRWAAYAEMEKNWDAVRNTGNALMNGSLEMKTS